VISDGQEKGTPDGDLGVYGVPAAKLYDAEKPDEYTGSAGAAEVL